MTGMIGTRPLRDVDLHERWLGAHLTDPVYVLAFAADQVIGGGRVSEGRLIESWGVADLIAMHWVELPATVATVIAVSAYVGEAVRATLERAGALAQTQAEADQRRLDAVVLACNQVLRNAPWKRDRVRHKLMRRVRAWLRV